MCSGGSDRDDSHVVEVAIEFGFKEPNGVCGQVRKKRNKERKSESVSERRAEHNCKVYPHYYFYLFKITDLTCTCILFERARIISSTFEFRFSVLCYLQCEMHHLENTDNIIYKRK